MVLARGSIWTVARDRETVLILRAQGFAVIGSLN